jgi:charged multivesicular body protein 4
MGVLISLSHPNDDDPQVKYINSAQSKSPAQPPKREHAEQADAIQTLHQQQARLEKEKERVQALIVQLTAEVKALLKVDKKKAKEKLRKKNLLVKRMEGINNKIFSLETQANALAEQITNMQVINAFSAAGDALNAMQVQKQVEETENVMEEIQEQRDLANELGDILNRPVLEFDEDELEQELRALDDMDLELDMDDEKVDQNPNLRRVKTKEHVNKRKQKDVVSSEEEEVEQDVFVSNPRRQRVVETMVTSSARGKRDP